MNERIFLSGYFFLLTAVIIGFARYKHLDKNIRLVLLLLSVSLVSEMTAYICVRTGHILVKGIVYHLYSIIEIILIGYFFLRLVMPHYYKKLARLHIVIWLMLGILNLVYLQKPFALNTNILMLESFSIITMCLYFIYWLLKNDVVENMFEYPHFWIAVLWLIQWSGTFFFWAFLMILYAAGWRYMHTAITIQGILLLVVYCGFCFVFLFHPKKLIIIEYR